MGWLTRMDRHLVSVPCVPLVRNDPAQEMISGRLRMMRRDAWQRLDNIGEVSSLVVKAYTVSILLVVASVLVWAVGDAWLHEYGYSTLDTYARIFPYMEYFGLHL